MPKLSAAQIAGVVKYATDDKAGRNIYRLKNPDTDGPIFVAIALAESGGDTGATHKNSNGTTDYGLWQINSVHASLLSGGDWKNATANFQMANSLYNGRGGKFTDWSTYKNQAYAAFMTQATAAWGKPDDSQATHSGLKDATDTVDAGLSGILGGLTDPATWIRVGEGVAGGVILILVAVSMMKGTTVMKMATRAATGGVIG